MSKMDEFMKKAAEDETIKAELKEILAGKKAEELTEEDAKKIMELAKKHGFELEEMGELSDDDLENVAGGGFLSEINKRHMEMLAHMHAGMEDLR